MSRPFLALTLVVAMILTACTGPSRFAERGAAEPDSLAGEWRFALDPGDAGIAERWFQRELRDRIQLPGVLQAQGYGNEIATDTPWVVTLGDAWWKLQPESLRARFSQPGNVQVPFLSQPPRHYLGAAWYQRDIDIPSTRTPRRYVLFLERPHWETTVWVDDRPYGSNHSVVAPHETDLGVLAPGRHRLTVRIDNRQIVHDPVNDGHGRDAHSVSDALGATWNGIAGRIELRSTALTWLEDVQVFPNVRARSALARVAIGNASGAAGSGELVISVRAKRGGDAGGEGRVEALPLLRVPVEWGESGGGARVDLALGENAATWDEFNPALHEVNIELVGAAGRLDRRSLRFGLREVSHRGKDLLINGRVVNLRTTHHGGDFPLTGYPATDPESWKRIFQVCRDYGLNGIRFHSWCPPEAAFIAADEIGFYLQAECGLWAPLDPGGPYTRFLEEETPRLLKAYGNYASFVLFSPSNEPAGQYTKVTPKWAADWYERDPRRLYAAGTGWNAPEQVTGGAQFAVLVRFGKGELRNVKGWFGRDYRLALEGVHIPVLSHENGQWCAYPDFDVIQKFTGYLRPGNYHIFRHIAEQTGVLEFNQRLAWASGKFQLACYKEDIEANLRTPGLAGYQLLDLHDYLGQGTALIGVVDAFWEPKSYVTAAEFRRFNGETVPLVRLATRTFSTTDTLQTPVELYHFAPKPLTGARPYWKLVRLAPDGKGPNQVVAEGDLAVRDIPIGKNIDLGSIAIPLGQVPAPAAYKLVVGLAGTDVENDWNLWVYPPGGNGDAPADVLVTSTWREAESRLLAGGKVLFVPTAAELDRGRSPAMSDRPVFWNIQMTVRPPRNPTPRFDAMLGLLCEPGHPALAQFPTAAHCDWQWTPLIDGVRSVNLTGMPRDLRPIVATIDDWNRNWRLGVLFECRVGDGRLLVSTINLEKAEAPPGARQLRRSLLAYMGSATFEPKASLTIEQVRDLWRPGSASDLPRTRVFDPDLDDGTGGKRKQ